MSPEAPSNFITPPPAVEAPAEVVAPAPELITVPAEYVAQQQEAQAQAVVEQNSVDALAAQAAQRINETIPGYDPNVVAAPVAEAPVESTVDMGRSGTGVYETPMPADPSTVPGWQGDVRR